MPWLTTDDDIGEPVAYIVYLPYNLDLESAFHGALLDLTNPNNWQEFGQHTPEQCAQAFQDALNLTFPLTEVPP